MYDYFLSIGEIIMSKFRKQHMSVHWHEIVDSESSEPAVKASLKEKATLVGRSQ